MKYFPIYTGSLLLLFLLGCDSGMKKKGATEKALVSEYPWEEKNFLTTPISLDAFDQGLSVSVKPLETGIVDYDGQPIEYRIACLTGYLIVLDRTDDEYKKMKNFFTRNGYVHRSSDIANKEYFIPIAFYGGSNDVDNFLDGKASDELDDYFTVWQELDTDNDKRIKYNNNILSNIRNQSTALDDVKKQGDILKLEITALSKSIDSLNGAIDIAKSNLISPLEFVGINDRALVSILATRPGRKPIIPYIKSKDFMIDVLRKNCQSIDGKSYDSPQIANKYLQKDLIKALDEVVAQEKQELQDIGLWPLTLVSAGRTPLQQISVSTENPIAAGMFSSGHIFCSSGDIQFKGRPYDDAKNHQKLKSILGRHGIDLPDVLSKKDPNHFFLSSFRNEKRTSNQIRESMLKDYYSAMVAERDLQKAKNLKLTQEGTDGEGNLAKINDYLQKAQDQLSKLQINKTEKELQKKNKQTELNQTKDAIASKIEAHKRKNNGSGRSDRGSWGGGSDGYWEKNSYREFHSNDGERQCVGRERSYENSKGDFRQEKEASNAVALTNKEECILINQIYMKKLIYVLSIAIAFCSKSYGQVDNVPLGTVMAYAGDTVFLKTTSWRICEGQSLVIKENLPLYKVIGWTYGFGTDMANRTTFNLPDYRGVFLRGVSGDTDRDPDKETRMDANWGYIVGNKVGSTQGDAIQKHKHDDVGHTHTTTATVSGGQVDSDNSDEKAAPPNGPVGVIGTSYASLTDPTDSGSGKPRLSNETRPANISVYWIIKIK